MSKPATPEAASLPPLLRAQVFASPGAVDWLRDAAGSPRASAYDWRLVALHASALLALIGAASCMSHTQTQWMAGTFEDTSPCAPAAACTRRLQLAMRPRRMDAFPTVLSIPLPESGIQEVQALGWADADAPVLMVAWRANVPPPPGTLSVGITRTQNVLRWVVPRAEAAPRAGAGK